MKYVLIILFAGLSYLSFGQNLKDSLGTVTQADSIKPHSVKKAVIFSACLPGAGQVYNHLAMPKGQKKAYWKVPLIYGGLGAATYFAIQFNKEKNTLKQDYLALVEDQTPSVNYPGYDAAGLAQLYRNKLTQRDLMFLGIGVVYVLNIVDAAVEAHFVKFDVSENLAMSVRPSFVGGQGLGVGLTLSFK